MRHNEDVNNISPNTESGPTPVDTLEVALAAALAMRSDCFDSRHEAAFRLFNGFYEGESEIVADLYAKTLVLHNYADEPLESDTRIVRAAAFYLAQFPWLRTILVKARNGDTDEARKGIVIFGDSPDRHVKENGVWYAIDLQLNQDSSFYLDTRHLREWLKANLAGKSVLNTFAYTGSLGVAARAGGAERIVQLDLSRAFLNVAKDSYVRNGFPIHKPDFMAGDFWPQISKFKHDGMRFDCVIVDPPLFSRTRHGTVDLVEGSQYILNKVRPLIADGGYLVTINNALFVSGSKYLDMLHTLCADGYLSMETLIPVPDDFIGNTNLADTGLPSDPSPFNHPTKIAILRVRRKDAGL
jgi:23S rRNA (cytosine1962-C5)-methyltransferase